MKALLFVLLCISLPLIYGCENYVEFDELNGVITQNDLSAVFLVGEEMEHVYTIEKECREDLEESYDLQINVENKFSLMTDRMPVTAGKQYKLTFTLRNPGANPVVLFSLWKSLSTQSRQVVLNGENGNPPHAETQERYANWTTFTEVIQPVEDEVYLMIRLYSGSGTFGIREVSIVEV